MLDVLTAVMTAHYDGPSQWPDSQRKYQINYFLKILPILNEAAGIINVVCNDSCLQANDSNWAFLQLAVVSVGDIITEITQSQYK